jgi:hypothetical protein
VITSGKFTTPPKLDRMKSAGLCFPDNVEFVSLSVVINNTERH